MTWTRTGVTVLAFTLLGVAPSPVQAQSATLTLQDALRIARLRAPAIVAEHARSEAAQLAAGRVALLPNPQIDVRVENWGVPAVSGITRDTFVTASQAIETGGKLRARRALAGALAREAATSVSLAGQTLAMDVANLYVQAVAARDRRRLAEVHAAELADLVRIMERRVEAGAASESELFRLISEGARIDRDVVMAEVDAARSLARLAARLGIAVDGAVLVLPPPPPVPAVAADSVLERRADVRAAREAVETARQHLAVEVSRRTPDVTLEGGLTRSEGYTGAIAAVSVPVPLFNRNRETRTRAAGELLARQAELDAVEQLARGDIAATSSAAHAMASQASAIRARLVTPAASARDAAVAAFYSGATDIVRLVDAGRTAFDAALIALELDIESVASAIEARVAIGESPLP